MAGEDGSRTGSWPVSKSLSDVDASVEGARQKTIQPGWIKKPEVRLQFTVRQPRSDQLLNWAAVIDDGSWTSIEVVDGNANRVDSEVMIDRCQEVVG